jgi:purine-nucleoside phosphorylase
MENTYTAYQAMLKTVRSKTDFKPRIGAVLGSGLGDFVKQIQIVTTISYADIPGLPVATNSAHKGQFVFGYLGKIPLVLMQGRLHCYEGYTSQEVVAPIRLMGMMGIKSLILTNAAGGINRKFAPGTLMLIDDQIACLIASPLQGKNIDELTTRFPDMSDIYDKKDTDRLFRLATAKKLPVQRGTYMQFYGPQYESKAEVRMAAKMGADACGMSTAIEAIASNAQGIKTIGISLIANMACGITKGPLSDAEILTIATASKKNITALFTLAIETLDHGE